MEITERLIRRIARQEFGQMAKSGAYTRGTGGGGSYTLPVAADGTLGGVQVGYTTDATARKYAVQLDNEKAYVNVPWTDHTYTLAGLVGGSVIGGSTQPIYWNGSSFVNTSYTLAKSVPSDAVFTDTNTWRPVQNNLDSTSTSDSLSAYQGYLLARGSARDKTKLPLAGGTMTGQLGLISNAYSGVSPFSYGLNCNNSDIIGINSLFMNDTSEGWDEGIEFKRSNNNWDSLYALDGTFHFKANNGSGYADVHANTGIAENSWSSKSDARLKDVLGDVDLTVEQIASMPAVRFTWKSRAPHQVHVGTLAQGVQKVIPEAVGQTGDGILTVAYGEAAFVSVVKVAQRVLELEELIKHGTHQ